MNVQEYKNELEELKTREFMMNMIDRWTMEDRRTIAKIRQRIKELEKELDGLR